MAVVALRFGSRNELRHPRRMVAGVEIDFDASRAAMKSNALQGELELRHGGFELIERAAQNPKAGARKDDFSGYRIGLTLDATIVGRPDFHNQEPSQPLRCGFDDPQYELAKTCSAGRFARGVETGRLGGHQGPGAFVGTRRIPAVNAEKRKQAIDVQ